MQESDFDPRSPSEYQISGVRIHALQVPDCVAVMHHWIQEGRRDYVVLTGAHGVVEMQDDEELRAINNAAGLVTPDGMPVVWMGKAKGHPRTRKVYAPDIMEESFARGVEPGIRHFLYGGTEGIAEKLKACLEKKYPGIKIVGTYTPPFRLLTEEEADEVSQQIDAAETDIVWVGLGCPKQERWMHRFRPRLKAPVLIGVGAGFDFLSGTKPLAPDWIVHSGFEWLYRTLSEPRRLWPRYSRVVPRFLFYALRELLGLTPRDKLVPLRESGGSDEPE